MTCLSNLTETPINSIYKENLNFGAGTVVDDCGTVWTKIGYSTFNSEFRPEDYGAIGDGIADDSVAWLACIAAVPTTGGTIRATGKYAINITINRPKLRITGGGVGRVNDSALPGGIKAFSNSTPAITISNDTQQNEGIVLENLEFNGQGLNNYGLKLNGGCYFQFFHNLTFQGFLKKGLHIESGATYGCTYLFFNNVGVQNSNTVACEHGIYVKQGSNTTFCEAIYFNGLRLTGVDSGYGLENAGSQSLMFTNAYFQIKHNHGVLLSKPFASIVPRLNGNGLSLDSDNSSDTLLTINFGLSTLPIEDYVFGFVDIDGKVSINGTLLVNQSPMHIPNLTKMVYPSAFGALYLTDSANPNSQTIFVSGETAAGRANVVAPNEVVLASGIGAVLNYAPLIAAPYYKFTNTLGSPKLIANGLSIELSPHAGGDSVCKSDITRFGLTTQYSLTIDSANGLIKWDNHLIIPNAKVYYQFAADGTTKLALASHNSSNNLFLGQGTTGTSCTVTAPSNINFAIGANTVGVFAATYLRPQTTNVLSLGDGTHLWTEVFATAGTINTSDERLKKDILPIDGKVLDAWSEVDYVQFRWIESVEKKNDKARIHIGIIAQKIVEVFKKHDLDATRYGFLCYDEWPEHDEVVGHDEVEVIEVNIIKDEDGNDIKVETKGIEKRERIEKIPAGNRYGIRSDQCLILEAALMRRELNLLKNSELIIKEAKSKTPQK